MICVFNLLNLSKVTIKTLIDIMDVFLKEIDYEKTLPFLTIFDYKGSRRVQLAIYFAWTVLWFDTLLSMKDGPISTGTSFDASNRTKRL